MKLILMLKAIIIILLLCSPLLINAQAEKQLFIPVIKYDTATFTGKIIGMKTDVRGFKSLNVSFISILTGDLINYDIPVNSDGTLRIKIPVECITLVNIESDYYNGLAYLIPGEESELIIFVDKDQNKRVEFKNSIGFTSDDANTILNWPCHFPIVGDTILTPEVFSQKMLAGMQEILDPIIRNDQLTPIAKQNIVSGVKFFVVFNGLLKYDEYALTAYNKQHKTDLINEEFHPQVPDQSYYSFLSYININDPIYLTASFYPMILKQIMDIKALAIPDIGDQPVDSWLNKVKSIMKDKLGCETGTVYDIMVCYSYVKQLNYQNPFSKIQKENIRNYFSNKSFAKVLFAKNEKVLQEAGTKSKTNIYELTDLSELRMDSIITKYEGKVVFVDFWATWCGPCLKAMRESETVRKYFENKEVVFLYVTDMSSPKGLWEQKVYEIKGEQYYITQKAMSYLYKKYDFTTIPHYLIYDRNGHLKYNHKGYMGNEAMRKWIEESL